MTLNHEGVTGSAIAQSTLKQKVTNDFALFPTFLSSSRNLKRINELLKVDVEIKTKLPILREELEQIYRLAAAITAQKAKFEESSAPDVYHVIISGLVGENLTDEERQTALNDIQNAVEKVGRMQNYEYST